MKKLLTKLLKKKKCNHSQNFTRKRYFSKDRTPMLDFQCKDCGFLYKGHVHTDASEWTPSLVVKEKGVFIVNEINVFKD